MPAMASLSERLARAERRWRRSFGTYHLHARRPPPGRNGTTTGSTTPIPPALLEPLPGIAPALALEQPTLRPPRRLRDRHGYCRRC